MQPNQRLHLNLITCVCGTNHLVRLSTPQHGQPVSCLSQAHFLDASSFSAVKKVLCFCPPILLTSLTLCQESLFVLFWLNLTNFFICPRFLGSCHLPKRTSQPAGGRTVCQLQFTASMACWGRYQRVALYHSTVPNQSPTNLPDVPPTWIRLLFMGPVILIWCPEKASPLFRSPPLSDPACR